MDYWDLIEPFWDEISIYDGPHVFLRQYAAAPRAAQVLFAAHWCESEVSNGGLAQLFDNSTGVLAPEAVTAFRAIGMPKAAAALERAMSVFGPEYPRERDVRQAVLVAAREPGERTAQRLFEEHDAAFYNHLEIENGGFQSAADAYATANA